MRGDGLSRSPMPAASSSSRTRRRRPGPRSPSPSRARGRWRSRSRRCARRPATGRRGGRRPGSSEPGAHAHRRAGPPRRPQPHRARRLRQRRRRPAHRRAGGRPGRRHRAGLEPSRAPLRAATVLAGEVALSGRLRAAARAERRMVEASRLGFDRLITGAARGGGSSRPASSWRGTSGRQSPSRLRTDSPQPTWTHSGRALRWPPSGRAAASSSRPASVIHRHGLIGPMTRIIQLTGALLGTLFGFALGLALLQRAGDLIQRRTARPS